MPSKKHRPEELIGKLREAEVVLAQGATTAEACRRIAISEQTYIDGARNMAA
jgi:putative transposase